MAGAPGSAGVAGSTGATGATGPVGSPGAAGATGSPGATVEDGAVGPTGPQGVFGVTGATGPAEGVAGSSGIAGSTGATGAIGLPGAPGMTAHGRCWCNRCHRRGRGERCAGSGWSRRSDRSSGACVDGPVGSGDLLRGERCCRAERSLLRRPERELRPPAARRGLGTPRTGTGWADGSRRLDGDTGPQGPSGSTGVTGAAGLRWSGPWDGLAAYQPADAVVLNGSSYVALSANTGIQPPTVR